MFQITLGILLHLLFLVRDGFGKNDRTHLFHSVGVQIQEQSSGQPLVGNSRSYNLGEVENGGWPITADALKLEN